MGGNVGFINPRTIEGYCERIAANSVPILESYNVMQSDIPEDRTRGKAASESALIQNIQSKSGPSRSVQAPERIAGSVNTSASNERSQLGFSPSTSINTMWSIPPLHFLDIFRRMFTSGCLPWKVTFSLWTEI